MAVHTGKTFSTKVRENDSHTTEHCAVRYKGAWCHRVYHRVHINGLYLENKGDETGMRWYKFKGSHSIKTISMMIRRTSNNN